MFHEVTRSFRRSRGKHGLFIQRIRIVLPSIRVPVAPVPVALKLRTRLFVFGPTCIAFRSPLPHSFPAAANFTSVCYTVANIPHVHLYGVQCVSLYVVHNEIRCRSCVSLSLFFSFTDRRREVGLLLVSTLAHIRSLVKSLRPSGGERSSPKYIDTTNAQTDTLHTYRDKCSFDFQEPRLPPFRARALGELPPPSSIVYGADVCVYVHVCLCEVEFHCHNRRRRLKALRTHEDEVISEFRLLAVLPVFNAHHRCLFFTTAKITPLD